MNDVYKKTIAIRVVQVADNYVKFEWLDTGSPSTTFFTNDDPFPYEDIRVGECYCVRTGKYDGMWKWEHATRLDLEEQVYADDSGR